MTQVRLTQIDEAYRGDHYHLERTDQCYFLREYTSGGGWSASDTNSLISNLKKSPSKRGTQEWKYKVRAMTTAASELSIGLNPDWLKDATLVPIPPSKAKSDPEYDDRMVRICRLLGQNVDVRELVCQTSSTRASHISSESRVTVEELIDVYEIDEKMTAPVPNNIAIVDDVLTAGTHFRAMHTVLSQRFPQVPIIGLFIARRVFP